MDAILEPGKLSFRMTGGILDAFVFAGPRPAAVVQQYQSVVGLPMMPPLWSTGFHQCRYGYANLNQMEGVLDKFNEHELPVDVIWADIDYMDNYKIWTVDEVHWPVQRFAAVADKIHEQDKKLVLIVDSGVRAEPGYATYDRLLESDAFIKDRDGQQPFLGKVWPRVAAFTDWVNPEAGLDEGLLSLCLPILIYMENPYRSNNFQ